MTIKKYYLITKQPNGIVRKCRLIVNNIKRSLIVTQETYNLTISLSSHFDGGLFIIDNNVYPLNSYDTVIPVPKNKSHTFSISTIGFPINNLVWGENSSATYDGSGNIREGELTLSGDSTLSVSPVL